MRVTVTNVTDEIFKKTHKVTDHHDDVGLSVNTTITDTSRAERETSALQDFNRYQRTGV